MIIVVEADERHVFWDTQATRPQFAHRPRRHLVVARYDPIQLPCIDPALFEQDSDRRRTRALQKGTRNDQALVDRHAERRKRCAEYLLALCTLRISRVALDEPQLTARVHGDQMRNGRAE